MNEYIHKDGSDRLGAHVTHIREATISIRKYVYYVVTITISIR